MNKVKKIRTSSIALLMAMVLCLGVIPSYKANATETVADVEAELTVDKAEVVLGSEDEITDELILDEGGYYRLYQEVVNITLTVQGKVESIYSNAYVKFDYQMVYMPYDSSSSTDTTTVYKGFVCVNQYTPYDETYVLEAQLQRSDNGQLEKVNCPAATVKVSRNFSDNEGPTMVNLVINRQGETVKDGKIEITLTVNDSSGMDEGDDAVSVLLASALDTVDEEKYLELRLQENGTYKGTIDVENSGLCQSKWYVHWITLYDTLRNRTRVEFDQESPYYFYIGQDVASGNEEDDKVPEDDKKPEDDKVPEDTLQQETKNIVEQIVAGTVASSVVDAATAEKVKQAISSGKSVTSELVVKGMEQAAISQNEKTAIEEKAVAKLGKGAKVQYFDVSIVLKAGDEELGNLHELQQEITITIAIPEELKANNRTYKVIRNHNGAVDVLDSALNADGTVSFKTARFSTYALAAAETKETNTNPTPIIQSTDSNKTPKTGDSNSLVVYAAISLVALAAIFVTKKRNIFAK